MKNFNKTRISFLTSCFFLSIFVQPNWVTDNFWYKAEFWEAPPFAFPFMGFILIYAALATLLFDQFIRVVKKYA